MVTIRGTGARRDFWQRGEQEQLCCPRDAGYLLWPPVSNRKAGGLEDSRGTEITMDEARGLVSRIWTKSIVS